MHAMGVCGSRGVGVGGVSGQRLSDSALMATDLYHQVDRCQHVAIFLHYNSRLFVFLAFIECVYTLLHDKGILYTVT